ncbi:unnamed protein product [Penicillium nalgiovense]|nr:unnamed protein product [Penicillium nalgiovense]
MKWQERTSDFLPAITTWEPIGIESQVAVIAYRNRARAGIDIEYRLSTCLNTILGYIVFLTTYLFLHTENRQITIMATETPPAVPSAQLATPSVKPQEISFTLPKALHTTAHVHLNFLGHCAMVFLATSSPGDSGGSIKPMGSFVYAMPDVSTLPVNFIMLCHISSEGNAILPRHSTWTGNDIFTSPFSFSAATGWLLPFQLDVEYPAHAQPNLNLQLGSRLVRTSSKSTISTTLYTSAPSIEYTNRIAKILARRFSIPVYVGCSIDPHGMGLEVAEEMEGLTKIVNVIMEKWEEHKQEKAGSAK